MSVEMKLEGLDSILPKLEKMNVNVNKAQNKALHAGADIVLQAQKDIVRREAYDSGQLYDNLKKGNISTRQGIKSISIGIQKNDNSKIFYGKFINWGWTQKTKKGVIVHNGIHFMERSKDENKEQILDAMKSAIKEAINSAKR